MTLIDQIAGCRKKIVGYAKRLTGNEYDAEDLAQDVIIHAIEHKHQFQEGTNLMAWLARMTHNLFVNQYRRNQKWANPVDISEAADWVGAPETVYREMEKQHFDAALEKIRESDRRCLELRRQGYDYEETAEIEGIPVGTVRSRLFRGRNQLEKTLKTTIQPMSLKVNRVNYSELLSELSTLLEKASEKKPVTITNGSLARMVGVSDMTIILALNALISNNIINRRKAEGSNVWEYWPLQDLLEIKAATVRQWVSEKIKEGNDKRFARKSPEPKPKPAISHSNRAATPPVGKPASFGYFVDGRLVWLIDGLDMEKVIEAAKGACYDGLEVIIVQRVGKVVAEPVVTLY